MRPFSFIINGRRWRFLRERLPDYMVDGELHEKHGDCDSPDQKNKAIRVHSALKDKDELETIIHEARHAENWEMYDETYVARRSAELTNLLWRLGYRKTTPENL
jgi:hypothetical protein